METPASTPQCSSLRYYLYQAVNNNNETLIHAVYPSVDQMRTFILYHPDKKQDILHLLHNLDQTIATIFSPSAVQHYLTNGNLQIQGHPRLNNKTKSYVKTIIDLTGSNPRGQQIPTTQPTLTNKRHHSGDPIPQEITTNLPPGLSNTIHQNTGMIEVLNETTARLRSLESNHTSTNSSISDLSSRMDNQAQSMKKQGEEIRALGEAYATQNQLITALQTTQVQQGATISDMNAVQRDLLQKINTLVDLATSHPPNAEDRMAAETHDE